MSRRLLIGGGHAHASVLKAGFAGEATLVTPYPHHVYSAMLPGFVAGHYKLEEIRIDLAALAKRAGVKLVLGRVVALDAKRRVARLEDGAEIEYDECSLDEGSDAAAPFMEQWLEVKDRVRSVAVVGGDATGVEMAMAVAHRTNARVTVFSEQPMFRPGLARRIERQLVRHGVELRKAAYGGEPFDLVIRAADVVAQPRRRAPALISCGERYAIADWGAVSWEGAWVWRWKDRIDRRWVAQFRL